MHRFEGMGKSASVVVLAVLAFVAVVPGGGFVFDDHVLIERNADLPRADVWRASWGRDYYATSERPGISGYYRPVAILSHALDLRLWARRISGYHVTNLVLHALACLAAGAALRALGVTSGAAWVTALLFAAHPAHAESVAFLSGRVDVLAGLFILAALAFAGSKARWSAVGVGVAAFLAFVSKELAVALPLLVLVVWKSRGVRLAHLKAQVVAIALAALVALVLRHGALGAWLPASASGPRPAGALLLPLRTLLFACASLYLPLQRISLEPDPARQSAIRLALGGVAATALWMAAWRADKSRATLRRALLAGGISLLPVLNFLPQETLLSERFLYLCSAFLLLPGGVLVTAGWKRGGVARFVTAGICVAALALLLGLSTWRARLWRDDLGLWQRAVVEDPNRAAYWDRLGLTLTERRTFPDAERALRRAVQLDPGYFNAQINLGVLLQATQRSREALQAYRKAAELQPRDVSVHLDIGMISLQANDFEGAMKEFETALRIKPDHPEGLYFAGTTALRLGRLDEARRDLSLAQRLMPGNPQVRAALQDLERAGKRLAPPQPGR